MAVMQAELAELEATLRQTFEHDDWALPMDETPAVISIGGTERGINMDLGTLGGSRPRVV
jgi:hypothetical protein